MLGASGPWHVLNPWVSMWELTVESLPTAVLVYGIVLGLLTLGIALVLPDDHG